MEQMACPSIRRKSVVALSSLSDSIGKYLERYQHEYCEKYYDGDLATIVLQLLKDENTNVTKKARRQVIRGLKNKHVTKMFYDKEAMYKTLAGFGENFVSNKMHHEDCKMAKDILIEYLNIVEIKPYVVSEDMDIHRNIKNLNTSAGLLSYGQKKGDIVDLMINQCLAYKEDLSLSPLPALAMRRSQIGGLSDDKGFFSPTTVKKKGRLVWCLEAGQILFESQYARPLSEHLAIQWPSIATGKTPLEIRKSMINWNYKNWLSIDFSKFDSTIQSWVIRCVFDIIKMFFHESYHDELDWISKHFITLPILMPDGEFMWKHKGIPSGSYFTQIVGSLANAFMILTYLCHKGKCNKSAVKNQLYDRNNRRIFTFMCMGDDNIIFTPDRLDKDALSKYVQWKFGIEVSVEKSEQGKFGQAPSFLKRQYHEAGEYRCLVDLILNMLHPERVREYKKKGFTPWHVLYGYYMTYPLSIQNIATEDVILREMHKAGGVFKMVELDHSSLPGSLGAWANLDREGWYSYIKSRAAALGEDVA